MDIAEARSEILAAISSLQIALENLDADEPVPAGPAFDPSKFFDSVRDSLFGGSLNQGQVDGLETLGRSCREWGLDPLIEQSAYVFATAYHETAQTIQPIEEYGGPSTRYAPWYGRGYVQLTWEENYEKQQTKLGHKGGDYKVHDDWNRALLPHVSADVTVGGMMDGDFTGKALDDYITLGTVDYVNARRIVNGTDKANTIAGYAQKFEEAIRAGFA